MDENELMEKVEKLIAMYENGDLGDAVMPEDANPLAGKYEI